MWDSVYYEQIKESDTLNITLLTKNYHKSNFIFVKWHVSSTQLESRLLLNHALWTDWRECLDRRSKPTENIIWLNDWVGRPVRWFCYFNRKMKNNMFPTGINCTKDILVGVAWFYKMQWYLHFFDSTYIKLETANSFKSYLKDSRSFNGRKCSCSLIRELINAWWFFYTSNKSLKISQKSILD